MAEAAIEPTCIARMARAGWPPKAMALALHCSEAVVWGALRDADAASRLWPQGVPVVDHRIERGKR